MAAVSELGEARQTAVTLPANIDDLKPDQEECGNVFIKGKDIVSLPPAGFGKRLINQSIVVNADWLKAGQMLLKLT